MKSLVSPLLIRNVVFGVEDSLVSTVGLLTGIASVHISRETLLLAGVVYIMVEGFSMSAGSFLSEESVQEFNAKSDVQNSNALLGGVVMFISSVLAGFLVLGSYFLIQGDLALYVSVVVALTALGILGYVHARISHVKPWPRVIRMILVGGAAIVLGIVVGSFFGIQ